MLDSTLNFSTVKGFNSCVGHVKITGAVSRYVACGCNFADVVGHFSDKIESSRISFLLSSLLVDKFQYMYLSFNMVRKIVDLNETFLKLCKWNQFNTVVVYYHPQLGVLVLNPQSDKDWQDIEFAPNEFVSIYTNTPHKNIKKAQVSDYLLDVKKVIEGIGVTGKAYYVGTNSVIKTIKQVKEKLAPKPVEIDEEKSAVAVESQRGSSPQQTRIVEVIDKTTGKSVKTKADAQEKQEKPKNRKLTPKYSVQVSNELFHNGNVEAWKNIMESYTLTHPDLEILLFHNDEVIKNVNSLFKWGKVKHGDVIFFALAGEKFRAVSKLQKYLHEGASNRFQQFLKKDVGQPLRLF